eukprot:c21196_g1_i1 orf=787-1140(+)
MPACRAHLPFHHLKWLVTQDAIMGYRFVLALHKHNCSRDGYYPPTVHECITSVDEQRFGILIFLLKVSTSSASSCIPAAVYVFLMQLHICFSCKRTLRQNFHPAVEHVQRPISQAPL